MRHRVKMRLVEIKDENGSPTLVPEGMIDLEKVRTPGAVLPEFLSEGPPLEPSKLSKPIGLEEITHIEQLIGEPLPDHRDEDLQPPVSARVQRILDRCSDRLRPATPDH